MHYLGGLQGEGHLTCGGDTIARTAYDFEIFQLSPSLVAGCGEIRSPREALMRAVGCAEFCLVTDYGRKLRLSFSDQNLSAQGDVAHVDVAGGLPPVSNWSLSLMIPPSRCPASKAAQEPPRVADVA